MQPFHLIILLLMNFFWGAVYSAYKVLAPDLPATGALVTLRFGLAGLFLMLAWPFLPGPAPRKGDLIVTCAMGIMLFAVGQRLQVAGNQLGTAGNSSVLLGLEPLVASIGAAIFLKEHVGPRRLIGFSMGLVGVLVLTGAWRPGFQWIGLGASLMFVSSFICEAAYSILGKRLIARVDVMKMLALSLIVGTAINLLIDGPSTLRLALALPARGWMLLLSLSLICTVLGYTVWFVVIRECPINVAALTIFAQTVFGVSIAAIWVKEKLRWEQLAGGAIIIAGMVIGLSRQIGKRKRAAIAEQVDNSARKQNGESRSGSGG